MAHLALIAAPTRFGRMVSSYTIHSFDAMQIVCLDTSHPAHYFSIGWVDFSDTSYLVRSFSARRIIYPGTNYPAHFFCTEWIACLDTSYSAAHSSNSGWEEVGSLIYSLLIDHTLLKVPALATILLYTIFSQYNNQNISYIT